ncbi:MAG TPA: hypothetical protein DFR83_10510, partial [Deltaproteobacteria bacterium]|nr:hypothetical protein [Deltaproteobacteria bacterium]
MVTSLRRVAPGIEPDRIPSVAVRTFVYTRFVVAWLEHSDATGSIIDSLPLDPTIRAFLRGLERLTDHEPFASTDHRLQTLTRAAAPQLASKPDPVVYLFDRYEAALDQDSRHHRGVFYTPTVVVDAVVGSVDRRLRERFDLPLGLADRTTPHARTPRMNGTAEAQDTSTPFVCILDPAAGTGAFLLGVLRRVRATLFASFEPTHTPTQIDQWAAFL